MSVGKAGGRQRGGGLIAALIVLACALAIPAAAGAEQFTVNSTGDETDLAPGDAACLTAGGVCTLRAAIEEANGLEEFDEIVFTEEVFDGGRIVPSTISLGSQLPPLTERGAINGRECATAAGVSGPCVGVDGLDAEPALVIHTAEFEISGLAVTGAETGVSVEGSAEFRVQSSWFGVKLDASPGGGNGTGIFIGPGSNRSLVGGEGPERGNVFGDNSGDGLDIHGASKVRVLGNYFGVEKDGSTEAPNDEDIEITSTSDGEFQATGNSIGTRVSFGSSATTPECDGGCNLVSGAESNGIDLEGDGGSEASAVATTIAGNYIGLNASGSAPVANAAAGVRVGSAVQTVIGGPKLGEANRISGGSVGVIAGPAAADLVVRGNLIGVDGEEAGILAPPDEGIVVNSEEVPSAAVEAAIVDNEIGMEGGAAIVQQGLGARIAGNEILGAETGIKTFGPTEEVRGNLIEGNLIETVGANGILVENGFNEILGNEIFEASGAGIWIRGPAPFGISENLVGGDGAIDENFIVGSGGAAIEITNVKETENEVARNSGSFNSGLFIDLVAAGAELEGPNNGIGPPEFTASEEGGASGIAEAGANVRVFRKQSTEAGELDSFLGEASADDEGEWEVVYDSAIPGGTIVAATQTSEAGGTSELATATTDGEAKGAEGGGGGGVAARGNDAGTVSGVSGLTGGIGKSAGGIRPRTKIVASPKRRSRRSSVRFEFRSDVPGSVFLCKLDRKPFDLCKSPKRYKGLKPGRHVFEVRSIDPAGHVDSSPAKKRFTVIG